jgi:hypothetical protein
MRNLFIFLSILILVSCKTQQVTILDGVVIKEKDIIRLTKKQDTVEYITLHNGKVISIKKFNKKWNETVSKTTKRLKKNN